MKLNLVAIVLFQLVGLKSSAATSCKEICTGIRQELLSESHTCSPALTISPSPAVYKSCQYGKKSAFDKTCASLCSKEETTAKSKAALALDACRRQGRGNAEIWCKRGFSSILKKLETYNFQVSELIIDYEEISKEPDEEVVMSSGEAIPQVDQAEAEVEANSKENNIPAIDNVETLSIEEPEDESLHDEEPKHEEKTGGEIEPKEEPKEELEIVQANESVSEEEATEDTHSQESEEVAGEEVEYVVEDEF